MTQAISKLLWAAAGFGTVFLARELLAPTRRSLEGQVVLITGGSRGLGYALARAFARAGCRIVICARNEEQLRQASTALRASGADVTAIRCDVTDRSEVRRLVEQTIHSLGRIDILVNNAGIIQVGPARQMRVEDFEDALNVMFRGSLYTILEVLPHMTAARRGSIVNITSIGGKISVPHLVPYNCAKSAAVALSEGLHAELAGDGILVLTVVPSLLRTGSHIRARFKGRTDREYAWFATGATLPGLAMNPDRAAMRIVSAVRQRRSELVLSPWGATAVRVHGLSPRLSQFLFTQAVRFLLPRPSGNDRSISGAEILSSTESRFLSLLNRANAGAFRRYQWEEEIPSKKDVVQEASEQSFPASDAPSWSSAHL